MNADSAMQTIRLLVGTHQNIQLMSAALVLVEEVERLRNALDTKESQRQSLKSEVRKLRKPAEPVHPLVEYQ